MKFLTNMDLNQNELRNIVLQPLAIAPATPKLGQIYFDTTTNNIKQYDGKEWKVAGTIVTVDESGTLIIDGQETEITKYELPAATEESLGGIKTGPGISITPEGTASLDITYYNGIRQEGELDNQVFERVLSDQTPHDGDVFIIKTLINGDKYSYSSFIYDNNKWCAMDGNVDASNVIMRKNIVTAGSYTQVGNITKGQSATGSIDVAGKSVEDVFQAIFTKEQNPTKTDPAVSLTFPQSGAKEVGTTVTPTYTATLSAGSYTYGPATGIIATGWTVTDTNSHTVDAASGQFDPFIVGDSTNYKITAVAAHGQGAIPLTNLGNEYPAAQIQAGSKSKTSGAVTGYRSFFYGSNISPIELNSASIRQLTNSNKAVGSSQTFSLTVVEGAKQVVIAFPSATGKTLSKVLDTGAFGTDIVGSFVQSEANVEGISGYEAVPYDVYVYAPDAALGKNTYTVTIS